MDPAALSNPDATSRPSQTPTVASKSLPNGTSVATKATKGQPSAPRLDLEPYYTEIKSVIGDHWTVYKDAVSRFVLGILNQAELSEAVEPFIFLDPKRENLHNQLICGLYANVLRDIPDAPVAPWVSANDKPTAAPKPASGDLAEQRLKQEIMRLPGRMRHRIKNIKDDPHKPLTTTLLATARALSLNTSTTTLTTTTHSNTLDTITTTTSTGLNRDLEIRRRYNLPLISELHDLPTPSALNDRILPICYEEGLSSGIGDADSCSDFLSNALSVFVKDTLTGWLTRTRCDMPSSEPPLPAAAEGSTAQVGQAGAGWGGLERWTLGIKTGAYKRKSAAEESAWERGELKRSEAGLFPVEEECAKEVGKGRSASGDVALVWRLGDGILGGMAPWMGESLTVEYGGAALRSDLDGVDGIDTETGDGRRRGLTRTNTVTGVGLLESGAKRKKTEHMVNGLANGINGYDGMDVSEDWGWQGARKADRDALDSLLDDCLDF